ncbi:MAG: DUF2007 domain-containing protein [Actinomycetota bacterium]
MPYCPQCGTEYRDGFTRCHDCDVELQAGPPPEDFVPTEVAKPFDPRDVPELVTVFTAGPMEAEIVRSLLESNGIPALVRQPGASGAYPVSVGMMGAGEVMVPIDRRDEALETIRSADLPTRER